MFPQFLIHLAGFGLLLCPLACAEGFAPCCAVDDPAEESACCGCHDTDGDPAQRPSNDEDERECIASRADLASVSRPSETLSRSLTAATASRDTDSRMATNVDPNGTVEGSARSPSSVPARTLHCALLL